MVLNKKTLKKTNHDQLIELIKQSSILSMRTLPILKWKVKLIRTQENGFGFGIRGGKVRLGSKREGLHVVGDTKLPIFQLHVSYRELNNRYFRNIICHCMF